MGITKDKKTDIVRSFQLNKKDTGSCEVQIALLTERINHLTDHLKAHEKDKHSSRGLIRMVERRKKLLTYLSKTNPKQYSSVIKRLEIRK